MDRLRDPVRIVDGRVVQLCKDCKDWDASKSAQHADQALAEPAAERADRQRANPEPWSLRRFAATSGFVSALVLITWQVRPHGAARTASASAVPRAAQQAAAPGPGELAPLALDGLQPDPGEGEADTEAGDLDHPEGSGVLDIEVELPPTLDDVLENSEEPLQVRLPTLNDWVFPVLGSDEALPLKNTRQFGAEREGVMRSECGRGHCGVDLDGPRGTQVVAVAFGVVTHIERRNARRSGKYVRIEHPDYVYTSYMHLDEIAEGLRVGDEVRGGDPIGTLGRTGIRHSAPHLHLGLEVPGGGNRLRYIDPTPYLMSAARLPRR